MKLILVCLMAAVFPVSNSWAQSAGQALAQSQAPGQEQAGNKINTQPKPETGEEAPKYSFDASIFQETFRQGGENFYGYAFQVDFVVNNTRKTQILGLSCAADGSKLAPVATNEDGTRTYVPWGSCTVNPFAMQMGKDREAHDLSNALIFGKTIVNRFVDNAQQIDVTVYALSADLAREYELNEKTSLAVSLGMRFLGLRAAQLRDELESGETAVNRYRRFAPLGLNPEVTLQRKLGEKAAFSFTVGLDSSTTIGNARNGRFGYNGMNGSDISYYSSATFEYGKRIAATGEFSRSTFKQSGFDSFDAVVVGLDVTRLIRGK